MTSPASIVVVDDSEDVRHLIAAVLRRLGYRATTCADADEAFETVRRERPDLVLTDVLLGTTNGLDMISRIRSDLPAPHPRFIACSGMPELEAQAQRRSVALFLEKPLTARILEHAVAAVLADRPIDDGLVSDAAAGAKEERAAAIEVAREVTARFESNSSDLLRRARWTVQWLRGYLGFGSVTVALVDKGGFHEVASSGPEAVGGEETGEQRRLMRHVIETGSTMVLEDARVHLDPGGSEPKEGAVRFFAGIPLLAGTVTIGALCVFDAAPRKLDGDDYSLLVTLGRRGSVVLSGAAEDGPPPFWESSGLLTTEALEILVGAVLRRARRLGGQLEILVFEAEEPDPSTLMAGLERVISLERVALAQWTSERLALVVMRTARREAIEDLELAVRYLRGRTRRLVGGLVSISAGGLPQISEREVLRVAESILVRQVRTGRPGIQSVTLRYEADVFREDSVGLGPP